MDLFPIRWLVRRRSARRQQTIKTAAVRVDARGHGGIDERRVRGAGVTLADRTEVPAGFRHAKPAGGELEKWGNLRLRPLFLPLGAFGSTNCKNDRGEDWIRLRSGFNKFMR